ncbi:sulfite exporter TauE/SafE family protein [Odoribacter sp. Z80]|uniref:sulfite exporter TauE/SafE family protein n=1 Tax=Odoribacter sp. Z80 TaxID=2304575 RepID=UPI001379B04D|nr:sulfite exporter TauE/SafE family protein [Odoribacter sp. Z80]NCE72954.1 sulfite exporter TauE/SafE family protein [Odoribacter sp. Z80]
MTLLQATGLILLGIIAGFINTFAGGGSMLVVPFLIFLGLPANVANATNRVAIFLQEIVSTATFHQKKILDFKTDYPLLLPTTLGSIAGAFTAVDIQEELLRKVIGGLLIILFFMILLDPNGWIKANADRAKARNPFIRFLVFFGIGFYGGFIQIGVGFFMLAGLVLGCGFDLLKANALKVLLILSYTLIALAIFIYYGLIDWSTGFILSCGNMLGAWLGTRLSIRWGAKYIRYILLVALVLVSLKLFNVF